MVRGFDCNSVIYVCDKLKELCQIINVILSICDIVKIGLKKIFCAEVRNDNKRWNLLLVTH